MRAPPGLRSQRPVLSRNGYLAGRPNRDGLTGPTFGNDARQVIAFGAGRYAFRFGAQYGEARYNAG